MRCPSPACAPKRPRDSTSVPPPHEELLSPGIHCCERHSSRDSLPAGHAPVGWLWRGVVKLLAPDATATGDGGGLVRAEPRPTRGVRDPPTQRGSRAADKDGCNLEPPSSVFSETTVNDKREAGGDARLRQFRRVLPDHVCAADRVRVRGDGGPGRGARSGSGGVHPCLAAVARGFRTS